MKYVASVSYDGSKFYGFQRLPRHKSVQAEIERVLTKINKTVVVVKGAGRTDRGVHALDQRVHFELSIDIPEERLIKAMNDMLDPAIHINGITTVDKDFHARFDVKKKEYVYVVYTGDYDPLLIDYVHRFTEKLDIWNMRKAAKYMVGAHSFEYFTSGVRESYNSIIFNVRIKKKGDFIYFTFEGKSFYHYMVRNLVGALFQVGLHNIEPIEVKKMVENTSYVTTPTMPPNGLYLNNIYY
ncbi:MAG: tRNA pseudouridine(38-40) synthase TruA [Bacilli bacterium]|nr:tRNA pseudouridine(38-40) synthase TruA [Bacilli bacterium]